MGKSQCAMFASERMGELRSNLHQKIKTAINNPRLISDRIAGYVADKIYSTERKNRVLSTWHAPHVRTPIDDFVFNGYFQRWVSQVYLQERDPEKRESLKSICMGGASGISWANDYDADLDMAARVGDMTVSDACPWYAAMDAALATTPPEAIVLQVGASSGIEMDYFARRFPHLKFIGTDIDEAIISRARQKHSMANLSFEVALAHTIFDKIPKHLPLVLFSSGSLQYVQPEHLTIMFQKSAQRGNINIILGEPWSNDGQPFHSKMSRWRGNFSFSHEYSDFAEKAGIAIKQREIIQNYSDPKSQHFGVKQYYLWCVA